MDTLANSNKIIVQTFNLWRLVKGCSKKRWADCAVRNLRNEIKKQYKTNMDVKIDIDLNKAIWSRGKKHLPTRIRVEISKRPSKKENRQEEIIVKNVFVPTFKGLQSEKIIPQE
ncbi:large subunit ribosomal protein L31e [Nematocida sp. AWRm77]|nr:large subunit ribosomal protein L31e [Nematocida sp. AWRm77]